MHTVVSRPRHRLGVGWQAQVSNMPPRTPPPTEENIERFIRGELGPAPMRGVSTFPYTVNQRLYHHDFSAVVAYTIQHPYMTTAKPGGSTPHNILSGSGYADTPLLRTESESSFGYKRPMHNHAASGIRVEQL